MLRIAPRRMAAATSRLPGRRCIPYTARTFTAATRVFKDEAERLYTVRPTRFWMDKILERESQKPIAHPEAAAKERKLIEKTMSDSAMVQYLPFKSSPELLDQYIFVDGRIRTGKLLEDLDAMAGAVAYKHIDNGDPNARPVTVVTACVDRLDLLLPKAVEDYKLTGQVTYVGTSSMEIFLKAETVPAGEGKHLSPTEPTSAKLQHPGELGPNTVLATRFTMVAIDSATGKSVRINPLRATTPAEERLFEFAKANKARKKRNAESVLTRFPPTPDERLAIHDIFLEYSKYDHSDENQLMMQNNADKQPMPSSLVWMHDTKIESNYLMQPQDRNIHNNIFGGYLMRRAFELAFFDATVYLQSRDIILLAMDEVTFRRPVHVGTLLHLKSEVIYAEGAPHHSFQVRVVAEVVDIERSRSETTNVFFFTLASTADDLHPRRVLPRTYAETMLWLEGKRRRQEGVRARHMLLGSLSGKRSISDSLSSPP